MRLLRLQLRKIFTTVDRRALAIDVASAGALGCVGDLICQSAIEQRESVSWRRLASVGSFEAGESTSNPRRSLISTGVFERFLVLSVYMGGFFHYLCQAFPPAVCAAGRVLQGSAGAGTGSSRAVVGRELQREGSSAHALGCSIADNCHDGSLMIPSCKSTPPPPHHPDGQTCF